MNNTSIQSLLSSKNKIESDSGMKKSLTSEMSFNIGIVVDVINDANHIQYDKTKTNTIKNSPDFLPLNYKNEIPNIKDVDYSYNGRIKVRILGLNFKTDYEKLPWAIPLDKTITQYPLLNEYVLVFKIAETFFYTKPLNYFNITGVNADFSVENSQGNQRLVDINEPSPRDFYRSYLNSSPFVSDKKSSSIGYLGKYFILNHKIRSLKTNEGDTLIESRFGQSIKFSAYDDNRKNDKNTKDQSYILDENVFKYSQSGGYGNPKITIRNRQRNLSEDIPKKLHPKLPSIPSINEFEKNYGGLIQEDINNDGSTIEIRSGEEETEWKTTVYKSIFAIDSEEQSLFNPDGSTNFTLPKFNDDQIVINTDRLIFSSRFKETLHFSKKRYGIVTDSEYTVDSNDQIVLTTNNLTCFNSPQIFLGQYGDTNEPALLGQSTVDWLYDLCNWLLDHVHWYHHVHPHPHGHPDAGKPTKLNTNDAVPDQTQIPVQQEQLKLLRNNLNKVLSRRVFLTGGGYSPGANGILPSGKGAEYECKKPVKINTVTGEGVVGDFKGRNRREGPVKIEFQIEK